MRCAQNKFYRHRRSTSICITLCLNWFSLSSSAQGFGCTHTNTHAHVKKRENGWTDGWMDGRADHSHARTHTFPFKASRWCSISMLCSFVFVMILHQRHRELRDKRGRFNIRPRVVNFRAYLRQVAYLGHYKLDLGFLNEGSNWVQSLAAENCQCKFLTDWTFIKIHSLAKKFNL